MKGSSNQSLNSKQVGKYSLNHYKILHNKKTISIKAKVLHQVGNKIALVLFMDITKLKKFEKERQSSRFKTIYFTSMAHDLRTPINSVMGVNQVLYPQLTDSSHKELLGISTTSC